MKDFINKYWKTLLFFALIGLVGGFFTGIYLLDSYPAEIKQQMLNEGATETLLGIITALQSAGYGVVLGALGIWLGKKIGLWKDERSVTQKPLATAIIVAVIGGLAMILPDILFFGRYSETIMESYAVKPTVPFMLASVTYGAVIEEVMLRLFMMSLIAFLLHKLFWRKRETTPVAALVLANILSAILFAAGHLPATAMLLGITPMILLRCFLLNGGFGLLFGWLYRKYGLRYSMLAHGSCHIVSKLIWILFL
jgi:hypothetical protein